MDVTPDYKRSEVGVIPKEWGVLPLEAIANKIMVGIASAATHAYREKGIPMFRNQDIKAGYLDDRDLLFVAPEYEVTYKNKRLRAGDLLTMRTGYPGVTAVVPAQYDSAQSFTTLITRPNQCHVDSAYLCHYLNSEGGQRFFTQSEIGGAQKNVNAGTLRGMPIPLPSVPEQRAIAAVLSDVDALLGGLDRLIAKKRDLKQAAMQQLLTGQTRLPGFNGEWEVKRLGDHMVLLRNGVNSRAELLPEGRVRYIHYGDVHACKDVFMSPASLPCLPDAKAASLERLRDGDLIFADASEDVAGVSKSVELRGVGRTEVVSGLHTIAARFDKAVLADGFKGYLQFCLPFAMHLRRLAAGTKVYATNRAHIASVQMRLPTVAEQTAIAAVLGDMDAELSALEASRDKTRALKQGMMQELLTGKTRLVSVGDAHA